MDYRRKQSEHNLPGCPKTHHPSASPGRRSNVIPWSVEKTVFVERASNIFILQAYLVKPNVWIYKIIFWNELFAEERKTNFQVAAQKYLGLVCRKGEE